MAIEAEAPDGTILEFPDDTPDDVIDRTMKAHIQKTAPAPKPDQPSTLESLGTSAMEGLPGRFGVNVAKGLMQLPGAPVEAIVGGGNFLRRQLGLPETRLEDTIAKDWGAEGWLKAAQGVVGVADEQ